MKQKFYYGFREGDQQTHGCKTITISGFIGR
jgi:hypothetical protein